MRQFIRHPVDVLVEIDIGRGCASPVHIPKYAAQCPDIGAVQVH